MLEHRKVGRLVAELRVPRWRVMLILLLALAAGPAWAQSTCIWNVNGSGAWDQPSNWNGCSSGNGTPAGTPGPADLAVIGSIAPNAVVDLGASARSVQGLRLSAGRIFGDADLNVSQNLTWTGGEIDGSDSVATLLTLAPGGSADISGNPHILRRRVISNFGTITWSDGDIALELDAQIDNQGVFSIFADAPIRGGAPTLLLDADGSPAARVHNSASAGVRIEKQGDGIAEFDADVRFDNGNLVDVQQGSLRISGTGSDFGSYAVAMDAGIEFAPLVSVTRTLTGGTAVSGAGNLLKSGDGDLIVTGGYLLSGETAVVGGILSFDTPADPLDLPRLRVQAPGLLTGLDSFLVGQSLLWLGGGISAGTSGLNLTLDAGANASLQLTSGIPGATLDTRDLINLGDFTVSANADVPANFLLTSASIDNQGDFTLSNSGSHNLTVDCAFADDCGFENRPSGTVRIEDIGGAVTGIGQQFLNFDNDGLVDLIQGCGNIGAPGTDTGTYRYAGSCTLGLFPRADFSRTLEASVVLDQQGSTELQVGGTLNINGVTRSFGNLILDPIGLLQGPADFTFTQNFIWRGEIAGTQSERTVEIAAGATAVSAVAGDAPLLARRTLNLNGRLDLSEARLGLLGNATLRNAGVLNLIATPANRAAIGCINPPPDCGTLNTVAGSLLRSTAAPGGVANAIEPDLLFLHSGDLQVSTGVLDLDASFTTTSGSLIDVRVGAGLRRASGTLVLAAGSLRGRGVIDADLDVDAVSIEPAGVGGTGSLGVLGNYIATGNTSYQMEVGGSTPEDFPRVGLPPPRGGGGEYDRLLIAGSASLAGTLDVLQLGGFTPQPSDFFDLLGYANYGGNVVPGANPYSGLGFVLQTQATRVRLARPGGTVVCTWNPAGAGADNWTNPNKWTGCSTGSGPGPGPVGTPGAPDTAVVGSGTVNLDVPVGVDELQFTGGLIAGPNNLSILNNLIWTGGRFQGSAGQTVTMAPGTSASFSGGQHIIDGRTFNIDGFVTWTTGLIELTNGGVLQIQPGGTLASNPSLALESIFGSGSGTPEVRNFGSILKNGANSSGISQNLRYGGSGSITVTGGQFLHAASSVAALDGSFTADAGASLHFIANSRTFGPLATLGGVGTLVFGDSGAVGVNAIQGCFLAASNLVIRNASVDIDCASPTLLDSLLMVEPLGELQGDSSIEIATNLTWGHGRIRGSSPAQTLVLNAGAAGFFTSPQGASFPRELLTRRLINHAWIQWEGAGATQVNSGAVFENASDGQIHFVGVGGPAVFGSDQLSSPLLSNVGGLFAGSNTGVRVDLPFMHIGSVSVTDGEFRILRGTTLDGTFNLDPLGTLVFDGATFTLSAASSVAGVGGVHAVNGANLTVLGSFAPGRLRIETGSSVAMNTTGPVTVERLELANGTLTGNDEIDVAGSMLWAGGTLRGSGTSPGPLVVLPGASLVLESPSRFLEGRVLRIAGSADWVRGDMLVPQKLAGKIDVVAGGELRLINIKTIPGYRCASNPCTVEFELGGVLRQQGDGIVMELTDGLLMTSGLLQVDGNGLGLQGGLQVNGGAVELLAATLGADPLILDGGVLRGNGTINGSVSNNAGVVSPGLSPGQIIVSGDYVQGASGSLDIQVGGLNPGSQSDLLSSGGDITLDGTLNVSIDGYTLTDPDTLEILRSYGSVSGSFASTNIAHPGYIASYNPASVVLVPGAPVALVVNSVDDADDGACDSSHCSLREAINASNLMPDPDLIEFNIPSPQCTGPAGACTIAPATPLPVMVMPVRIDGYTQPGASANTQALGQGLGSNAALRIELNGSTAGGNGLVFNTPSLTSSEVHGLALYHWNVALVAQGPVDNQLRYGGNFIGLRADGSLGGPAGLAGIAANGGSVMIGDGTPANLNVIGGSNAGVRIDNSVIGGSLLLSGNLIGTAPDGLSARPNGVGVELRSTQDSPAILIGGNLPDQRNIIAGNSGDGVNFNCSASVGNCFDNAQLTGNYIGVDVAGGALGNGGNGIALGAMPFGVVRIGGLGSNEGNRIANNNGNGIVATFSGGRASFVRNEISGNGSLGIDLGGDGRTGNDPGDPDIGPNGRLNFPAFQSYSAPGGNSAIIEVLLDTPDIGGNYPARVDFYKAVEDEPGVWLGNISCSQPAVTCLANFGFPGGVTVGPNDVVLGVVTDGFGKSSEASFYASTASIASDNPDPSPIGTPYTVVVNVVSPSSPFAPLGQVAVDDGTGNNCMLTLTPSGPALSTGSCQLPSLAPAGNRTLTANYAPASTQPFEASSVQNSHQVAAATVIVNSVADPGNGVCDASECTLREGVALANALSLPDVDFDPAFFSVPRTITLNSGQLAPTQDVDINGPGAGLLTIAGNGSTRLLATGGVDMTLSGLTLSGGRGVAGAAIEQIGGVLSLVDVVLSGNQCGAGGTATVVSAFGSLALTRTTVAGNVCANVGGIYAQDGTLAILDSTLSGNSGINGEALRVTASSSDVNATLTNVTISGNNTAANNSAIRTESLAAGHTVNLTLTHVTISGNSTSGTGNGALWLSPGPGNHVVRLRNTLIAGNSVAGSPLDIEGNVDPASASNVVGVGGGLVSGVNGNQVGVLVPLLAPLANYGGSTQTRALLPGSVAINAGNNSFATGFDQRGIARPQQTTVDVGAYESRGFVLSTAGGTPQTTPALTAFPQALVVGVAPNGAGEPVDGGQLIFDAPDSGASALLSNPATISAGTASTAASANDQLGSYVVNIAPVAGATGTASFALTNSARATYTAIASVNPATTVVGQPYSVSVGVLDGIVPVNQGMVEVRQLSDGSTCSFDLGSASSCQLVGNSALNTGVRASYLGAGIFAASQSGIAPHEVLRADTSVVIVEDSPDPSVALQPINVRVTLAVLAPGAGTPSGEVLITDGIAACTITLPNLSCALVPKALGEITLEARYLGDANFNPSTDTEAHGVSADGADLSIIKRNGLRLVPGGVPSTYILLVSNDGPQSVVNARVTDILPPQFSAASWRCCRPPLPPGGNDCPVSGNGNLDALVSIATGASMTCYLTATAQAAPEQVVTNTATVSAPPNAPDPDLSNNASTDIDPVGLFADGLETENE